MGKWLIGFFGVLLVTCGLGLIKSGSTIKDEVMPDLDVMPPILEAIPSPTEFVSMQYEYIQPPAAENIQLTIAQVRWCVLRENMIDSLGMETLTIKAAHQLNDMIREMHERCGKNKYKRTDRLQAEKDVEIDRDAAIDANFHLQNGEH